MQQLLNELLKITYLLENEKQFIFTIDKYIKQCYIIQKNGKELFNNKKGITKYE